MVSACAPEKSSAEMMAKLAQPVTALEMHLLAQGTSVSPPALTGNSAPPPAYRWLVRCLSLAVTLAALAGPSVWRWVDTK